MSGKNIRINKRITLYVPEAGNYITVRYSNQPFIAVLESYDNMDRVVKTLEVLTNLTKANEDLLNSLIANKRLLLKIGAYRDLTQAVRNDLVITARNVLQGIKE